MNKYQEVLTDIRHSARHLNNLIYGCDDICDEYVDDILTDCDLLQELVDKATPIKPIHHLNSFYRCKNCNELFQNHHYQNHCPNCGQALDWSDTNE